MPLFKGKGFKSTANKVISYITREDKALIVSSQHLDDSRPYAQQFKETYKLHNKGINFDERKYYHFKISCDPLDNITPQQSHKLAEKIAQRLFNNHECIISTHTDKPTIHSHIVVNAVSFESGLKLRLDKSNNKDTSYAGSKDIVQEIAKEMGLTPMDWRKAVKEKRKKTKTLTDGEYKIKQRLGEDWSNESWKEVLRNLIDEAKNLATSRKMFEKYLKDEYGIEMPRNTAKTVSFMHPHVKDKAVRGEKLGSDYTAEALDKAIVRNKEVENGKLCNTKKEHITGANRDSQSESYYRGDRETVYDKHNKPNERDRTREEPSRRTSNEIHERLQQIHKRVSKIIQSGDDGTQRNSEETERGQRDIKRVNKTGAKRFVR